MSNACVGLLINDYEFIQRVGSSGYSDFYRVRSQKHHSLFLAKVTKVENRFIGRAWSMFESEIKALSMLDHPNIVKLYGHFRHGDMFVLILEHCRNGSLEDYMNENGPLDGMMLVKTVKEVCLAVKYALARGVHHRDIRPGNVMFDDNGRAKLVNFGVAIAGKDGIVSSKVCDGTCSRVCMAPEILNGSEYDPEKSDIWSLGVTVICLVRGSCTLQDGDREAWIGDREVSDMLPQNVNPVVTSVVRKMVAADPKERCLPSDDELDGLKTVLSMLKTGTWRRSAALVCSAFRDPSAQKFITASIQVSKSERKIGEIAANLVFPKINNKMLVHLPPSRSLITKKSLFRARMY